MDNSYLKRLLIVALAATRRFRRRWRTATKAAILTLAIGTTGCIVDQNAACDSEDGVCPPVDACSDPNTICNFMTDEDGDGYALEGADCNDTEALIYPGAPLPDNPADRRRLQQLAGENGLDIDCDGVADIPGQIIISNPIPDFDGDGYTNDVDCDDDEPLIHPGASLPDNPADYAHLETLAGESGLDIDCDGELDIPGIVINYMPDMDGDGYSRDIDCDDHEPLIHPGATFPDNPEDMAYLESLAGDSGLDIDCDGELDIPGIVVNPFPEDRDGDGVNDADDCEPDIALVHPGAAYEDRSPEIERLMELCMFDYDCDGEDDIPAFTNCFPDWDGDGYVNSEWAGTIDCDEHNALIHPNASYEPDSLEMEQLMEDCHDSPTGEIDYDCDGVTDIECMIIVNG